MIDFTGPLGGVLALTWGAGATIGYGFAYKIFSKRVIELTTSLAEQKEETRDCNEKCEKSIAAVVDRLRVIEDRYMNGLERQNAQLHDSTVRVIENGIISPPLTTARGKVIDNENG